MCISNEDLRAEVLRARQLLGVFKQRESALRLQKQVLNTRTVRYVPLDENGLPVAMKRLDCSRGIKRCDTALEKIILSSGSQEDDLYEISDY